jgi:hypothetical protein
MVINVARLNICEDKVSFCSRTFSFGHIHIRGLSRLHSLRHDVTGEDAESHLCTSMIEYSRYQHYRGMFAAAAIVVVLDGKATSAFPDKSIQKLFAQTARYNTGRQATRLDRGVALFLFLQTKIPLSFVSWMDNGGG